MSSLLQFRGDVSARGVGLQFVLRESDAGWNDPPLEEVLCTICGGWHERIHIAYRKPCGMFGPWVVFRYNGEKHVPDLSIPISTDRLPRDAQPLSDAENAEAWHSS
jgi:hypothetical protein